MPFFQVNHYSKETGRGSNLRPSEAGGRTDHPSEAAESSRWEKLFHRPLPSLPSTTPSPSGCLVSVRGVDPQAKLLWTRLLWTKPLWTRPLCWWFQKEALDVWGNLAQLLFSTSTEMCCSTALSLVPQELPGGLQLPPRTVPRFLLRNHRSQYLQCKYGLDWTK